ncbi:lytic transglycosylase [Methylobacterium sp. Leaf104]|uniref:transglycosylase SLT domain-containing protein n=1 Tax=Methylobacterium TaxID=407 RepID=UPI0006FE6A1B|nr:MULTISPECIES: transglycosylase SLT domain-containing protein [Methylobacterium]KQP41372.1 lytic transglycosylase [Methylobacterium sp. Leaf104]MCI9881660.1 transglycosylase SLT domain-containing protein [Methylobacterium goesingense]
MNQRFLLLAVAAVALPCGMLPPGAALAQGTAARDNIDALIEQQAKANGVPLSFVHQVVKRESNYNPNAKGGSALGLMQIKHATAKGLGYQGDAAGLFDPRVNLRYGIAYLAGAYRAAKGDIAQAYAFYNRGYYYAAKRLGIETSVPDDLGTPKSGEAFASAFARADSPAVIAANTALAYAPSPAANGVPTETVEVPLPPRRPASLAGLATVEIAALAPADATSPAAISPHPGIVPAMTPAGAQVEAAFTETIEVPLPPRRPSAPALAAAGRPAVAKKAPVAGTVLEASALPAAQ